MWVIRFLMLSAFLTGLATYTETTFARGTMSPYDKSLVAAVADFDYPKVARLLGLGANPDTTDEDGDRLVFVAAAIDQWRMVELFMDKGADIWWDTLGQTVALTANTSRIKPSTDEGEARDRVVARLVEAGYPWPPPRPQEVKALKQRGAWPPAGAKDGNGRPLPRP